MDEHLQMREEKKHMIKQYFDTDVQKAARMINLSDEDILGISNGEVARDVPSDEEAADGNTYGSLVSGEIFKDNLSMGHIHLPIKIVNINYLYGEKPILPQVLKMSRSDLTAIVYGLFSVCTNPADKDFKKTDVNYETDEGNVVHACPVKEGYRTGSEAIYDLLTIAGCKEKDCIILQNVPVLPLALRMKDDRSFYVEELYESLIFAKQRYERMMQLSSPLPRVIELMEKRSLQQAADALINNGIRGERFIREDRYGFPLESLHEVYEIISDPVRKKPEEARIKTFNTDEFKRHLVMLSESKDTGAEDFVLSDLKDFLRPYAEELFKDYYPEYTDLKGTFLILPERYPIYLAEEKYSEEEVNRTISDLLMSYFKYVRKSCAA